MGGVLRVVPRLRRCDSRSYGNRTDLGDVRRDMRSAPTAAKLKPIHFVLLTHVGKMPPPRPAGERIAYTTMRRLRQQRAEARGHKLAPRSTRRGRVQKKIDAREGRMHHANWAPARA